MSRRYERTSPITGTTWRRASVLRIGGVTFALAALAVVFAASALRAGREVPPGSPEGAIAIPVRTVGPSEPDSDFGRVATGTLVPTAEVRIGFPVPGVVDHIHAREGDSVEKGDLLATLDATPYRAGAEQARARTKFLQARIARTRTLAASGAVTPEELEGDVAELAAAEAELDRAEWNEMRTSLRAPFRGQLKTDRIEPGQVVEAGDPAFDLISIDSLEITVSVAVADLPRIDFNAPVGVVSIDLEEETEGRILHRPVSGDARTSAVPLRVRIANPTHALLAGTVAEVRFGSPGGSENPTVPISALRVTSEGTTIFLLEGDIARARRITTGAVRAQSVEVTSGLTPSETVIAEPPDRLRDGDRVRVVAED